MTKDHTTDKRVRDYLFPFWSVQFGKCTATFGEGFMFSRFNILWLMRKALMLCPLQGRRLDDAQGMQLFGECCLIGNDLSAFLYPKSLPTDLAAAANFLPPTEYCSQEDYDRDVARTLYMLNYLAPNAAGTGLPEFAEELQSLLGYRVTEYCDLAFASAMKQFANPPAQVEAYQMMSISPSDFKTTTIAPDAAEKFLSSISAEEQELSGRIATENTHSADLTIFRDRPLLRVGSDHFAIDIGFILDKAGRGLFWTALKRCADVKKREELLKQWGELFERYVNDMLAMSLNPLRSSFLASPIFDDGAQVADGAIKEGRTLILLEYKASTISNAVKYADNPVGLEKVLQAKFVLGEGTGRKGLAQIAHAIKRFEQGNAIVERHSALRIDANDVNKIIPVLLHSDNALRTPRIPHYMATEFKSLASSRRFTITPLVLLPITELEELEGHFGETLLSDVFESFMAMIRSDKAAVFMTRGIPKLKGKYRKNGPTLDRFDHYIEDMLNRLFPGNDESKKRTSTQV